MDWRKKEKNIQEVLFYIEMPPPPLLAPLIIYLPRGIKVKELNVKYRPLKIFSPTAQDIKEKKPMFYY